MNKPHKHAAVIKAWADGAVIQYKSLLTGIWTECYGNPLFLPDTEYQVKPEKKKCWVKIIKSKGNQDFVSSITVKCEEEKERIAEAFLGSSSWKDLSDWFEVEYEDE